MDNLKCIICSNLFNEDNQIYGAPCGHRFHYLCINKQIKGTQCYPQHKKATTEDELSSVCSNISTNNNSTLVCESVQNEKRSFVEEIKGVYKLIQKSAKHIRHVLYFLILFLIFICLFLFWICLRSELLFDSTTPPTIINEEFLNDELIFI